ncbi:hypothetical protein SeMB42_g00184 [Synchytrium endobioticum]|uniref:Uncharacterized protein n=1 Tax=Synchytrium endobioticum TaxID=286115 RepID=A0A507DUM8_9FUNG|nr:hypothetical protein SeMB42_g00184 [Synchytrium endobioticum]
MRSSLKFSTKTMNEYLFMANWTANPFRPLQSVGEVPRYASCTKDRTTPMKCPVPPVLKVSPKVVALDDDQYLEPKEAPKAKAVKPSSKAKAVTTKCLAEPERRYKD